MTSTGSSVIVLLLLLSSSQHDERQCFTLGNVILTDSAEDKKDGNSEHRPNAVSNGPGFNCPNAADTSPTNSFLWSIEGRDRPSYFFGTIHVPYTRVWDYIPSNAKAAFRQSDAVHLELDLLDPETISALHRCQLLPQGKSLSDVIPRPLYLRLKRHLQYVKVAMPSWLTPAQKGQGLYADYLFDALTGNWERKRPIYVMMMINSLTEADIRLRGVPVLDLYLAQEARRMKKKRGAVERVEEHCLPLNEMSLSQVVFALERTLSQHETRRLIDSSLSSNSSAFSASYYTDNSTSSNSSYSSSSLSTSSSSSFSSSSPYSDSSSSSSSSSSSVSSSSSSSSSLSSPSSFSSSSSSSSPRSSSSSFFTSDDLVDHYNCGDLNQVLFSHDSARVPNLVDSNSTESTAESDVDSHAGADVEEETARQIDEYFREELIFKRNEKMAERVDRLLRQNPKTSFFFAFGAGHFIGNRSVIELLQKKGYNISHSPPGELTDTRPKHKTRHDRRKLGQRHWLHINTDRPVTDSLHLRRSQFNDLWIRLEDDRFRMGGLILQQLEPTNQRLSSVITMTTLHNSSAITSSAAAFAVTAAILVLLETIRLFSST